MIIVGDIHIDKRFPYTNKKTHERWRDLQDHTINVIFKKAPPAFQVGDLFDNFMVTAEQFVRADHEVASKCIHTLAGNHDLSNNIDKKSAVQLLLNSVERMTCVAVHGINYILVPHQLTQEAFEDCLASVERCCSTQIPNVLLLHCNYGDREGTQTENYLRPDVARELVSKVNGIVFGHEHNGGYRGSESVVAVGSILPMNFGEMTDKFVWDVEDWKAIKVWDSELNYKKLHYKEFLLMPLVNLQFIELVGEVNPAESLAVKRLIAMWYSESETIIAIKDSTTPLKIDSEAAEERIAESDWETAVMALMTDDEKQLFLELKNEIENPNAE